MACKACEDAVKAFDRFAQEKFAAAMERGDNWREQDFVGVVCSEESERLRANCRRLGHKGGA